MNSDQSYRHAAPWPGEPAQEDNTDNLPERTLPPETKPTVGGVLIDRGLEYGPAWLTTSMLINQLNTRLGALMSGRYFFNWVMILNKLVRLIATPNHRDSWLDIAGYAQLVLGDIDDREGAIKK